MGEAARGYAEQLQRYGHGHALWWPQHTQGPDGLKREIDIGDVGYIDRDGAFHPLFNVTYSADDERNAGCVPTDNFAPLAYSPNAVEMKESFLPAGPMHSSSVTSRRSNVGFAVYVTSLSINTPLSSPLEVVKKLASLLGLRCPIALNAATQKARF